MARARNIKPKFFQNDELGELPPLARLLFIGLWTIADFKGCLEFRPKRIKTQILPYDECDIELLANHLDKSRFISIYTVQGQRFAKVLKFEQHQTPHKNERDAGSEIPDVDKKDSEISGLKQVKINPEKIGSDPAESLYLNPESGIPTLSAQSPDEQPVEDRRKREPSADDVNLAGRIFGLILQTNPTAKKPNLDAWADDIRLMREIDKRSLPDIWSLFQWVRKDAFWRPNVMSPAKLREKWDQLTEKRNAPVAGRGPAPLNDKFHFDQIDRSGDAIAMAESMKRHGIVVPPEGEEIEL